MNIKLNDFMSIVTYDGLIQPFTINTQLYPGALCAIEQAMKEEPIIYIEHRHPCFIDIWFMDDWIKECKRREEQQTILKNYTPKPTITTVYVNAKKKQAMEMLKKLMGEIP